MFRILLPLVLIGLSLGIIFGFASPIWNEISLLQGQVDALDNALDNARNLENERDKLVKKHNAIDRNNLLKLERMLPDNVDNIRLILEIEKIAAPYGMVLSGVKYDTFDPEEEEKEKKVVEAGTVATQNRLYGEWDLEFATKGSYSDFLSFLSDLEKNLRIVDISSITFSSDEPVSVYTSNKSSSATSTLVPSTPGVDQYTYGFKIKTYWMKN